MESKARKSFVLLLNPSPVSPEFLPLSLCLAITAPYIITTGILRWTGWGPDLSGFHDAVAGRLTAIMLGVISAMLETLALGLTKYDLKAGFGLALRWICVLPIPVLVVSVLQRTNPLTIVTSQEYLDRFSEVLSYYAIIGISSIPVLLYFLERLRPSSTQNKEKLSPDAVAV